MVQLFRAWKVGLNLNSHSQCGQDLFAWRSCGEILDGSFIDIGCNDPIVHNNTAALEEIGWSGLCIDRDGFDYSRRSCLFIKGDATSPMPEMIEFIKSRGGVVDYLSVDADDDTVASLRLATENCRFRAITVEHDKYRVGSGAQDAIFRILSDRGYARSVVDVIAPKCDGMPWSCQPFEDWYVLK